MSNTESFEADFSVPSPCIGVCRLDDQRAFCLGCWRTLEQIRDWSHYNNTQRLTVVQQLKVQRTKAGLRRPKPSQRRRHADQYVDTLNNQAVSKCKE